ncbi:MAG: arginine--tRNA ligase [Candidatus Magasanikbacteria bacterium CG10_big_fil_rev_8_21_14_0_10_40_10]|uniref:Arginine--tRNA ligase n=1 Tax=Candidatus Magasanikbacteria bacterium CG10_big_fil_rev_8_21_14_0_10_40_10 TaxID=1974648 RepID=A0A2M6W5A0_9BACT|nr:MAG: arginine--tRNA ligase [Candidatus Magasanikbacteria bacterium CG10_big_fil_rev_8_21_14_0_10_40_10]
MEIKNQIAELLAKAGVNVKIDLITPPNPTMGDLALSCFELAKANQINPAQAAEDLAKKISTGELISGVKAVGPYVNLYLNSQKLAEMILTECARDDFGRLNQNQGRKIMVEFAHPNTHKAFHIGHLRNIITGESITRLLENTGYQIIRANYQGDVGMHIAKCLWGIAQSKKEYERVKTESLEEKVKFLGKVYALGGRAYETDDKKIKQAIVEFNDKIYSRDNSIKEIYETTRHWSLEYFDHVYQRVGSRFDRLYFESEVFAQGKEIVEKFLTKGIFVESQGAIIFAGSQYGLHDRVFINSNGFPTYEAKDMGLAVKQFSEYDPDKIIHVVGKEQAEYFKVIFKALEFVLPSSQGKEYHLSYGWVTLKEGKMSSRTGQVILGEWLLDEVEKKVNEIMKDNDLSDKENVIKKVALSAVKYSFLKTGVKNDIKFDLQESISLSGDSGPYLLYILARIKSILRKAGQNNAKFKNLADIEVADYEKQLLLKINEYAQTVASAAQDLDPSKIARYLFELAQKFNAFYENCPVLPSQGAIKDWRLAICDLTGKIMDKGLSLLGIDSVEKM